MNQPQEDLPFRSAIAAAAGWAVFLFVMWLVFAFFVSAIALMVLGADWDRTWHVSALVASLVFVFVVIPATKFFGPVSFRSYLLDAGVTVDDRNSFVPTSLVFALIAAIGVFLELRHDISNVLSYHQAGAAYILLTSMQPAISEELVIRGVVFGRVQKLASPLVAIGITAILFGLLHVAQGPMRIVQTTVVGVAFGTLRWRTGTVWPAVLAHFLLNVGFPVPVWSAWLAAIATSAMISIYTSRQRMLGAA